MIATASQPLSAPKIDALAAHLFCRGAEMDHLMQALDWSSTAVGPINRWDIGMPEVDGLDLLRRIRALPPEQGGSIPAVALTAYARVEDRERVLASGFQIHMTKPVAVDDLIRVVARATGRLGGPEACGPGGASACSSIAPAPGGSE